MLRTHTDSSAGQGPATTLGEERRCNPFLWTAVKGDWPHPRFEAELRLPTNLASSTKNLRHSFPKSFPQASDWVRLAPGRCPERLAASLPGR